MTDPREDPAYLWHRLTQAQRDLIAEIAWNPTVRIYGRRTAERRRANGDNVVDADARTITALGERGLLDLRTRELTELGQQVRAWRADRAR